MTPLTAVGNDVTVHGGYTLALLAWRAGAGSGRDSASCGGSRVARWLLLLLLLLLPLFLLHRSSRGHHIVGKEFIHLRFPVRWQCVRVDGLRRNSSDSSFR
jgi:hypothetical protein